MCCKPGSAVLEAASSLPIPTANACKYIADPCNRCCIALATFANQHLLCVLETMQCNSSHAACLNCCLRHQQACCTSITFSKSHVQCRLNDTWGKCCLSCRTPNGIAGLHCVSTNTCQQAGLTGTMHSALRCTQQQSRLPFGKAVLMT